jgi:hypothetical protein
MSTFDIVNWTNISANATSDAFVYIHFEIFISYQNMFENASKYFGI